MVQVGRFYFSYIYVTFHPLEITTALYVSIVKANQFVIFQPHFISTELVMHVYICILMITNITVTKSLSPCQAAIRMFELFCIPSQNCLSIKTTNIFWRKAVGKRLLKSSRPVLKVEQLTCMGYLSLITMYFIACNHRS